MVEGAVGFLEEAQRQAWYPASLKVEVFKMPPKILEI